MADTSYTRTFMTTCNGELLSAINADTGISSLLFQITNDPVGAPGLSVFWFESVLSPSELIVFDALLASWVCPVDIDPRILTDVTTPTVDDILSWNGSTWAIGPEPLQNLFEIITADTGSVLASTPTDTLQILGGSGITTTFSGNVLTIDSSIGSLTLDTFITGTAVNGDTIIFNGTDWIPQPPSGGGGISHQLSYCEQGTAKNEWLELYGDSKFSNETMGVMPFKSKVVGITFSNKKNGTDLDIRIYSTPEGAGVTPKTLDFTWSLVNKRVARKTNFPVDIIFDAGDKIAVYVADAGKDPQNVVVTVYFESVDTLTGEGGEDFSGNFASGTGGGSS